MRMPSPAALGPRETQTVVLRPRSSVRALAGPCSSRASVADPPRRLRHPPPRSPVVQPAPSVRLNSRVHAPDVSPQGEGRVVSAYGSLSCAVARVLVFLLCVQPVSFAFAADVDEHGGEEVEAMQSTDESFGEGMEFVDEVSEVDPASPAQNPDVDEVSVEAESVSEESSVSADDPEVETVADGETTVEAAEGVGETEKANGEEGVETEVADDATSDDVDDGEVEGSSEDKVSTDVNEDDDTTGTTSVATTTEEVASTSSTSTIVSDVSDDEEEGTVIMPIANDRGNKYTFGEGDCTLVADGEFYCVEPTAARHADADPRVYAEKDREGDREIFYFDGAEVTRITNNAYDDFAPVFDNDSRRIVWQATIFDRTQIMVHDLTEKTTRQITTGKQNSSNPDIRGNTVVWQEWVDTNWEVMMTDVDTEGEYVAERLTDNAVHDMFPQLFDDMVTWQHEQGNSWEVVVHDLKTGKEHALQKDEDTKYENPRFVLLFDSTHENGDVETIGYDLDSGEMMELGTRANPEPVAPVSPKEEIPDVPLSTSSSTMLKIGKEEGGDDEGGI